VSYVKDLYGNTTQIGKENANADHRRKARKRNLQMQEMW
jgi:hypothetical protein